MCKTNDTLKNLYAQVDEALQATRKRVEYVFANVPLKHECIGEIQAYSYAKALISDLVVKHDSDCSMHNAPARPVGHCDCSAKAGKIHPMFAECSELKTLAERIELYAGEVEKYRMRAEAMDAQYTALAESALRGVKNLSSGQPVSAIRPDNNKLIALVLAIQTLELLVDAATGYSFTPNWLADATSKQAAIVQSLTDMVSGVDKDV